MYVSVRGCDRVGMCVRACVCIAATCVHSPWCGARTRVGGVSKSNWSRSYYTWSMGWERCWSVLPRRTGCEWSSIPKRAAAFCGTPGHAAVGGGGWRVCARLQATGTVEEEQACSAGAPAACVDASVFMRVRFVCVLAKRVRDYSRQGNSTTSSLGRCLRM